MWGFLPYCLLLVALTSQHSLNIRKIGPQSRLSQADKEHSGGYEEMYFTQLVDHFNSRTLDSSGNPLTYQQRYLYNDAYWGQNTQYSSAMCRGPILFYTGNESPVTDYYKASGFFVDILAPRFGALLIYGEHRYFGKSLPFGQNSWTNENIGYLTPEQALADYADLITFLKSTLVNASDCPVFSFGGSYGGMLTTWFRIKYPNIVMGGLAASAPFGFEGSGLSPYLFTQTTTQTFEAARPTCSKLIATTITEMLALAEGRQSDRMQLAKKLRLCSVPGNVNDAVAAVYWVMNGLMDMAMLDYPYPTDYGIPVMAWPVNYTCSKVVAGGDRISSLAEGIGSFYNATGQYQCYNITLDNPDWGVGLSWPYLACTSTFLPYGVTGMFPFSAYNRSYSIASCKAQFGVTLQPSFPQVHLGGFDSISQSSYIIFSNGLLDPWHTSGVLQSLSDTLIAVVIPAAAHHLDLWGPSPSDPIYVQTARQTEATIISQWLLQYFQKLQ